MIRVSGLRKRFGSNEILKGIDFEVPPQTVLGVIGPSGSGKSTLLRCLNGLETISGGTIECDNVRLQDFLHLFAPATTFGCGRAAVMVQWLAPPEQILRRPSPAASRL